MEHNKQGSKQLSVRAIEAMRPGDKVKTDGAENAGLRVTCGSSGLKTFTYRYRSPETGKLVQVKIGNFPGVKLAEARLEVSKMKELRAKGVCPKAERDRQLQAEKKAKAALAEAEAVAAYTVTDLVEQYLTEVIEDRTVPDPRTGEKRRVPGARKPKGQWEVRRTLHNDAVRVLGHKPAAEVKRKDVVDLIKEILDRGARVQAGNVLREFIAAYEYAIGLELLPDDFPNPAWLAKASLKTARIRMSPNKGRRVLSDKELAAVLAWLPGSGYSPTQKNVMRFTLWTGCRTGEVCNAEWKDVDLEAGTWHLRDSKNSAERYVQLPTQAVEFLRQLKLTTDIYLFPSTRTKKPIQQKSLTETKWHLKNPEKVKYGRSYTPAQLWLDCMPDWSPHDLRRTVRTGLARMSCPSEVAEAVLGHSRKGIEGTYDLHSYEAECRQWLQRWADHLDVILAC